MCLDLCDRVRKREGEGEGRVLYIDSYVTLRYVTSPLLFFSLVGCGYDEDESFEVSTKESRKKREREKESYKLQVSCLYILYFTWYLYTLPYLLNHIQGKVGMDLKVRYFTLLFLFLFLGAYRLIHPVTILPHLCLVIEGKKSTLSSICFA